MRLAVVLALASAGCGRLGFEPFDPTGDGGTHELDIGNGNTGPANGVFIEINTVSGASFGGLSGADQLCLTTLTAQDWLGKAAAQAHGQLTAAHVHAWLCYSFGCIALARGQTYAYASAVNATRGGATFVASTEGFLVDDGHAYEDDDVFGADNGFHEYFTGRAQDNTSQSTTCGDWQTTTGQTDVAVSDTPFYPERLSKYPGACADDRSLICAVDPLP